MAGCQNYYNVENSCLTAVNISISMKVTSGNRTVALVPFSSKDLYDDKQLISFALLT